MSQENVERSEMPERSVIPLTVRRLKPGTYDQWRKTWDDPEDPDSLWVDEERAYIARSLRDPDVVVAFALFRVMLTDWIACARIPRTSASCESEPRQWPSLRMRFSATTPTRWWTS